MDGTMYWGFPEEEEEEEAEEQEPEDKNRQLEVQVATLKKELAEARKDLAAKAVLLSKRDVTDKAAQEKWAEQRAAELAAAAAAPKDQVIRSLEQTVLQLELTLAQRTEELEESKRLFASQKRALKDALSAAAEREAAEAEADAAGRTAATDAAEEEMERVLQELSQLKTRSALELAAREAEVAALKQQLLHHQHERDRAVEEARALAAAEAEVALAAAEAQHAAQLSELQADLSRLRSSTQRSSYLAEDPEDLSIDLAAIAKEKVQLQREFDAYKDLCAQTARQHREEQARLLEENASLKARIAAEAARVAMGGGSAGSHTEDAGAASFGAPRVRGKTFAAVPGAGFGGMLDQWLSRLDGQRKGLVPLLVLGSLVLLVLFIAVVRAAASARGEQKGALCFLSKLGIQIGEGCGTPAVRSNLAVAAALSDLSAAPQDPVDVEVDVREPLIRRSASDGPEGEEFCEEDAIARVLSHTKHGVSRCSWQQTTTALLSLQLGWGLWLFPSAYARLGWIPALAITVLLALSTAYSGSLFTRLYAAVPHAVLFGDVGKKAAGKQGRTIVYVIIYSLDATRCVILHLAATQSLQHALGDSAPPMWQCGLAVLVMAGLFTQIRALSELSWFFMTGTSAQLVAIGIVIYQLLSDPDPNAKTELVRNSGNYERQFVAIFNMVFAYGGQFAFTELMTDMKQPSEFPKAINVCTVIMSALYAGLASAGYWSKGHDVADIVIFSLGENPLARVAAGCILIQALAQYLVNLNVWTHNLMVLVGRAAGHPGSANARSASEHCRWRWLLTSAFVVSYSWLVSMFLPYFSSLVGIVASSTYLVCAYTLPCWFALQLLGGKMWRGELWLCHLVIPLSLAVSCAGLFSSVSSLIADIKSGGSGFGPPV
ncbi:hypothetical protein OEZ85_005763 [Tetradesmus obliquus]|uniref:Amino acid transporter transmembrane domain-containing protein n=1 Tax=Tetradesmus obliquus TaxID=3088 RepID=A0ABY8UF00_TETOB|nr:hypothetical protein OEZ85_005763 [Tetradesmus obliquus]